MQRHFERELEELKANLIRMGSLVDRQMDRAAHALIEGNLDTAQQVMECDVEVDTFDTQIDEQCQRILALSQPVATDLRLLMAGLRINNQLERAGDIAVNIAHRVEPLVPHREYLRSTLLPEMLQIARSMICDSLDSFIHNNPELATRVLETDDVVDKMGWEIFERLLVTMKQSPQLVEPGAHIILLSRHIERLADHATNIAEDVIFLVDARVVKHRFPEGEK